MPKLFPSILVVMLTLAGVVAAHNRGFDLAGTASTIMDKVLPGGSPKTMPEATPPDHPPLAADQIVKANEEVSGIRRQLWRHMHSMDQLAKREIELKNEISRLRRQAEEEEKRISQVAAAVRGDPIEDDAKAKEVKSLRLRIAELEAELASGPAQGPRFYLVPQRQGCHR